MTQPIVTLFARHRRSALVLGSALLVLVIAVTIALRARSAEAAVLRADPERIRDDPALRTTALTKGAMVYAAHCAACHGAAGKGDRGAGVPDLTDADHLYGDGKVAEIEETARYGIRSGNKRGFNLAVMPAYARAVPDKQEPLPPQTPAQVEELTQFLLSFTGRATDPAAAQRGRARFDGEAGCWDCHSHDAGGDPAIGAPTLSDDIWLYGGSHDDIYRTLTRGRAGISPAFARVLNGSEMRSVAVYVASLAPPPPAASGKP